MERLAQDIVEGMNQILMKARPLVAFIESKKNKMSSKECTEGGSQSIDRKKERKTQTWTD